MRRWQEAHDEYADMFVKFQPNDPNIFDTELLSHMHSVGMGLSRCLFHLGHYKKAIWTGQQAVTMDRTFAGVHKLVALPQRALARQLGDELQGGQPSFANPHAATATTIADAIRTMHRGHMYEAPWDNVNRQANKDYLMELMAEAAIGAFSARFSKLSP
jgi:hypothetical protein